MRKQCLGESLIEVFITVIFIGIGVLALIRFQNYLAYDTNLVHQKGDAIILAANELETLRNFQVLNTTNGYTAYQDIASGSSSSTISGTTYTTTWTVTPNNNPTYKTVSVVVSWTDSRSNANSVTLVSNIASIDPAGQATVM